MLKVAHLSPFPPSRDGIADYTDKLLRAMALNISIPVESDVFSFKRDGGTGPRQYAWLGGSTRDWLKVAKRLANGGYDIIHLQFDLSNFMLQLPALALCLAYVRRHSGAVLAATYHEASSDERLYGWIACRFYRRFSRLFSRVYVHGEASKRSLMASFQVPSSKVRTIEHGTFEFASTLLNHDELRVRWDLGTKPVLLSFGYIYRTKGIEHLISAIELLAQASLPLPLVVVAGQVPERKGIARVFQFRNARYLTALHRQISSAGLDDSFRFVGRVEANELYSLFTLADVCVLPYTVVDQSGVLNIAVAAHLPVIASDIGGLAETLSAVGVTVPPASAHALARELQRLLASPDERRELSARYAHLAGRLGTDRVANETLADYASLAGHR